MPEQDIQLDHVVLLVPYAYLSSPPNWITDHFVVSGGGQHADGRTENRLVLFSDGTYLELIAFIDDDPEKRKGHFWDKPYGFVDYALTTAEAYNFDDLHARLKEGGTGIDYTEPKKGGRKRPDGVELQWEVTFPLGAERGEVPFWCHDITPRERRVPVTKESTGHPSAATGMGGVTLRTDPPRRATLDSALSTITNSPDKTVTTPLSTTTSAEARISVEKIGDVKQSHSLTLLLRTSKPSGLTGIHEDIGEGHVSIEFEQVK